MLRHLCELVSVDPLPSEISSPVTVIKTDVPVCNIPLPHFVSLYFPLSIISEAFNDENLIHTTTIRIYNLIGRFRRNFNREQANCCFFLDVKFGEICDDKLYVP